MIKNQITESQYYYSEMIKLINSIKNSIFNWNVLTLEKRIEKLQIILEHKIDNYDELIEAKELIINIFNTKRKHPEFEKIDYSSELEILFITIEANLRNLRMKGNLSEDTITAMNWVKEQTKNLL